jgi:hypothetical protein
MLVEDSSISSEHFEEAFRDLVEPELNRLDKAVASAKKMATRRVREQLVFGIGSVTLGLAAGLTEPTVATYLASLLGAKFTWDVIKDINVLLSESPEARASDFFFLWKIREARDRLH